MIYRNYANKQKVAKLLHKYMHRDAYLVHDLLVGITELDKRLYSSQTRKRIQFHLQNTDRVTAAYLDDPIQTRTHVYRFHLKGSNSMGIVLYFLQAKYSIRPAIFPSAFESDWDTSILINPSLCAQTFNVIVNTCIPIIQQFMMELSRVMSARVHFHTNIKNAILTAVELMNVDPEYEQYRSYPLTYKENKVSPLRIHDDSNQLVDVQKFVDTLGLGGRGLYVTSNRNGGVPPSNAGTYTAKFYLGRVMASVVASRDMWLPIELFDISMNYQNEDLAFAWETYSEYNIQYLEYDFRVSSPTALYFDISKCIRNAHNTTKKNKVPARIKRIQELVNTMIIPYATNNVIRANLERHTESASALVRNIRRGITLKN